MRCVVRNPRFAVYDDFLAPADFAGVRRFVRAQDYVGVHSLERNPVWRPEDGEPLASVVVRSSIAGFFVRRDRDAAGAGL